MFSGDILVMRSATNDIDCVWVMMMTQKYLSASISESHRKFVLSVELSAQNLGTYKGTPHDDPGFQTPEFQFNLPWPFC